jgi:hypothetical protein
MHWLDKPIAKMYPCSRSLGCNECTCVILYGSSFSNFVAVLAEETETSAFWANFASNFLDERSNLAPISSVFFSQYAAYFFYFLIQYEPVVLNFLPNNEWCTMQKYQHQGIFVEILYDVRDLNLFLHDCRRWKCAIQCCAYSAILNTSPYSAWACESPIAEQPEFPRLVRSFAGSGDASYGANTK